MCVIRHTNAPLTLTHPRCRISHRLSLCSYLQVHHTLLGSTLYAMETGEHPAVLRNSVTSPAGTTASAIYELENGKFRTVIKDAICKFYTFMIKLLKCAG